MKLTTHIVDSPVENLGVVEWGKVYRSAQPTAEGFVWLAKELGVNTIINLRSLPDHDDRALADRYQIIYRYPFTVATPPSIDVIKDILSSMEGKICLVHCAQGQDRTGLICGSYRLLKQGWSLKEANDELLTYVQNPLGEIWIPITHKLQEVSYAITTSTKS